MTEEYELIEVSYCGMDVVRVKTMFHFGPLLLTFHGCVYMVNYPIQKKIFKKGNVRILTWSVWNFYALFVLCNSLLISVSGEIREEWDM